MLNVLIFNSSGVVHVLLKAGADGNIPDKNRATVIVVVGVLLSFVIGITVKVLNETCTEWAL
jgi:hypothetical protein